ncbi:MAG: FliH/SctL family protein [Myxococcota bacterium]
MTPPPDPRDTSATTPRPFAPDDAGVRPAPWLAGASARATAWPPGVDEAARAAPESTGRAVADDGPAQSHGPSGGPAEDVAPPGPCPHCEEVRAAAAAELERLTEELTEPYQLGAQALERAIQELTDRFADNVIALAARLATAILHRDAEIDEQPLIENIHRALQVAGPVTTLTLRCHAEDVDAIRKNAPSLAAEISGRPVEVTVRPSGDVDRGSCIVLFDEGIVDARWQVQIDRLSAAVRTTMTGQPLRPGRRLSPTQPPAAVATSADDSDPEDS